MTIELIVEVRSVERRRPKRRLRQTVMEILGITLLGLAAYGFAHQKSDPPRPAAAPTSASQSPVLRNVGRP